MMITLPWLLIIRLYYENLSLLICPFIYSPTSPTICSPPWVAALCDMYCYYETPTCRCKPHVPLKFCPTIPLFVSRTTHLLKQKGGYFFKGHWLALSLILWALAGVAASTTGDCWRPFSQSHAARRLGAIGGRRSRLPFGAFQEWLSSLSNSYLKDVLAELAQLLICGTPFLIAHARK